MRQNLCAEDPTQRPYLGATGVVTDALRTVILRLFVSLQTPTYHVVLNMESAIVNRRQDAIPYRVCRVQRASP